MSLQDVDYVDTPFYKITNHRSLKESIIDVDFKTLSGILSSNSFDENTIAYCIYDNTTDNESFVKEMTNEFYKRAPQIETYLQFLWFTKDNSVSLEQVYGQFTVAKKFNWWTGHNIFSTCDGQYKETTFSVNEIKEANDLLLAFTKNCINEDVSTEIITKTNSPSEIYLSKFRPGVDPLRDENRIERSLTFLSTARSASHLPQKITHYMSILECLFSTSSNQIVRNITQRTAAYLEDEKAVKIIKTAYDIRSRFVHGEKMKKSHDTICETSIQTDDIIRRVLKKIIISDYATFLKDNRGDFFKQLTSKR